MALYSHTTGRVRAYGQLSGCFETSSIVRQGCPLSLFLFNFVMDDILGQALKSITANFSNVQDETLFDLAMDLGLYLRSAKQCYSTGQKLSAHFSNLRHLWRCTNVSLATKVRVYNATVRSTLLYGCETWPLRSGDLYRLQVFDHRCLRSIGHFSWKLRITYDEVRHRIFGDPKSSRKLNQIILGTRIQFMKVF